EGREKAGDPRLPPDRDRGLSHRAAAGGRTRLGPSPTWTGGPGLSGARCATVTRCEGASGGRGRARRGTLLACVGDVERARRVRPGGAPARSAAGLRQLGRG